MPHSPSRKKRSERARPTSKAPRPPGIGFEIAKGPTVYGADYDVIEHISDRVNFLGDRSQLGLEAGQAVYDELVDGFVELRLALGRRAAFAEALRRRRDGEPADDPTADDRLIEIVGRAIFDPTYVDLVSCAADAYGELLSRRRLRGDELYTWVFLCIDTRGELWRISAEVEELAGQALAQGVPLAAWVAASDHLAVPRF